MSDVYRLHKFSYHLNLVDVNRLPAMKNSLCLTQILLIKQKITWKAASSIPCKNVKIEWFMFLMLWILRPWILMIAKICCKIYMTNIIFCKEHSTVCFSFKNSNYKTIDCKLTLGFISLLHSSDDMGREYCKEIIWESFCFVITLLETISRHTEARDQSIFVLWK